MATKKVKARRGGNITIAQIVAAAAKEGFDVKVSVREKQFPGFFMIFVEGGGAPTIRHESAEAVASEAERLAKLTDKNVFVLMAVSKCKADENPINWSLSGRIEPSKKNNPARNPDLF